MGSIIDSSAPGSTPCSIKFSLNIGACPSAANLLKPFNLSAYEVDNLIRAVTHPYPGAYTYYNDKRVSIFHSSLVSVPSYIGTTGQIMCIDKRGVLVQSGTDPLWFSDIYVEGEKVHNDFFKIGTNFGYSIEDEINYLRIEINKLKKMN